MRFTIVTPSFNQLDWLELCIASVADQHGVVSIEHLVCDGGSEGIDDFKGRMLARFPETSHYRLEFLVGPDAGMYDAINKGLRKATGDICAYLNCDEQYLPRTLRWVADYLSVSPETEVLFGAAIVTRADGSYVCDRRVMVPTRWHTMVSGNLSIFTSSTFFRRKSVVERGLLFDPQWRVCGDAVWALRLLEAGLRMKATNKPLSAFAETGSNMSAVGNPRAAEEGLRLELSAPAAARAFKPGVLLAYRFRRWLSGAYALKPHSYAVYTAEEADRRQRFAVDRPIFRWKMGAAVSPE